MDPTTSPTPPPGDRQRPQYCEGCKEITMPRWDEGALAWRCNLCGGIYTRCKACDTLLHFVRHIKTGKWMPLEAVPSDKGTWLIETDLTGAERYRMIATTDRPNYPGRLHVAHWGNCPEAARFHDPDAI